MDNISEQLVKINKTSKEYFLLGTIWVVTFCLVFFFVLYGLRGSLFSSLSFLIAIGVIFGAYKLSKLLNVEYEYIVVNRDLDIDKITAQSSRKRIVSIKLNEVLDFGEFTSSKAQALANRHFDEKFICCNANDKAHYLTYKHPKKGMVLLIIAMNERTKAEALKSIPRTVISK